MWKSRNWHKLLVFPEEGCKSCLGLLFSNEIPSGDKKGTPRVTLAGAGQRRKTLKSQNCFQRQEKAIQPLWGVRGQEKKKNQKAEWGKAILLFESYIPILAGLIKCSPGPGPVPRECGHRQGAARGGGSRASPARPGAALQEPSSPPCLAGRSLPCLWQQEMFLNLNNAADLRADSSDNEKKEELLLGNDCCFVTFP